MFGRRTAAAPRRCSRWGSASAGGTRSTRRPRATACRAWSASTAGVAPGDAGDTNAPVLRAGEYAAPVLGLFGGADRSITADDVERFRQALEAASVWNQLVTYVDAPHSFFDRTFVQHRDACDDAWRKILAFLGRT
jgi:carboxymethylenebutenolidase